MDVLVQWRDNSKNVVAANELQTVNCKNLTVGCSVKMCYVKKWYYGKVLDIQTVSEDSHSFDSEDDVPLANLKQTQNTINLKETERTNPIDSCDDISEFPIYDSDDDPPFGICEAHKCTGEVFAACHRCEVLLCFRHFIEERDSCEHGKEQKCIQEEFVVEGEDREEVTPRTQRSNAQKFAKKQRNLGIS